jgi:hypothetical protein
MSFAKRQADLKDSDLRRRLEALWADIEREERLDFLSPRRGAGSNQAPADRSASRRVFLNFRLPRAAASRARVRPSA